MSDHVQSVGPRHLPNRRGFVRRDVRSLAYVDLGHDNGGIVLNMSEGGLAVHSAVSLDDTYLPAIRFQLPQCPDWIEARGQIVWTSDSKRQAGISFVEIPALARRQIRQWIAANHRGTSASEPLGWVALPRTTALASATSKAAPSEDGASRDRSRVALTPPALSLAFEKSKNAPAVLQTSLRTPQRPPEPGLSILFADTAVERPEARSQGWWGFLSFLGMLAIVSFIIGLAAGRGDFSRLGRFFYKSVAHADASPQLASAIPAAVTPASAIVPPPVGRVTIASRAYVPVVAPDPLGAPKVDRLQVGQVERRVEPDYPLEARIQKIEGTVQLRVSVAATGFVQHISVIAGPSSLIQPAIAAVREWHYKPTLLDGHPIETEQEVAIVFWLPPSSARTGGK
ncbi:MAG TPA: TonB family protein [Candidatus Limnocylindrales bacterium]|nr:TonB family protein [Candidatus Limnocylindrales bacterium]